MEDIKLRFQELIHEISVNEISEMEQGLIMEGMPVEEFKKLLFASAVKILDFFHMTENVYAYGNYLYQNDVNKRDK